MLLIDNQEIFLRRMVLDRRHLQKVQVACKGQENQICLPLVQMAPRNKHLTVKIQKRNLAELDALAVEVRLLKRLRLRTDLPVRAAHVVLTEPPTKSQNGPLTEIKNAREVDEAVMKKIGEATAREKSTEIVREIGIVIVTVTGNANMVVKETESLEIEVETATGTVTGTGRENGIVIGIDVVPNRQKVGMRHETRKSHHLREEGYQSLITQHNNPIRWAETEETNGIDTMHLAHHLAVQGLLSLPVVSPVPTPTEVVLHLNLRHLHPQDLPQAFLQQPASKIAGGLGMTIEIEIVVTCGTVRETGIVTGIVKEEIVIESAEIVVLVLLVLIEIMAPALVLAVRGPENVGVERQMAMTGMNKEAQ